MGKWVEELPYVLWTYQTTPRRSTVETSFPMTYGAEVVIPLETGFPTLITSLFALDSNGNLLENNLDLIEERREKPSPLGLSIKKDYGYCKKPSIGKVGAQLGRAIPHHLGS